MFKAKAFSIQKISDKLKHRLIERIHYAIIFEPFTAFSKANICNPCFDTLDSCVHQHIPLFDLFDTVNVGWCIYKRVTMSKFLWGNNIFNNSLWLTSISKHRLTRNWFHIILISTYTKLSLLIIHYSAVHETPINISYHGEATNINAEAAIECG